MISRFITLILLLPCIALAQRSIPEHGGKWVHDEARVLSGETIRYLEQVLQLHRDSTSNQIAVYIVPSLDGDDIDDYGNRVFAEWKLGQKGKDNGVLLLIALQERKVRIEVGYGLEGVLTDLMSSRINRNEIAPYFQKGDYDGGVRSGVEAIIQVIKGEYVNEDPVPRRKSKKGSSLWTTLIVFLVIIFLSSRRGGRGGRGGGYWSSGGGWIGPAGGFGSSSGSWGSGGSDFGGGGFSGGGGSSDSW